MIQLQEVSLAYGDRQVLDRFTLTLPEQGILCLMGPSGCGKTTLLRVLLGLEPPQGGRVTGLRRGEAAVLFQEDRLLPWLNITENLTAVTGCSTVQAEETLAALGLADCMAQMPDELSGGMRRRAALARALVYPARLLVFDEPLKGLDAALKASLYPLIRAAAAEKPLLMVTHDPEEAAALADRTLQLDGPPLRIRSEA